MTGATLKVGLKPEIRAASAGEARATPAIGLLPGDGNEYIPIEGGLKRQRGFFTRDQSGAIVGVDPAGRIASRV